jgi:hypothetical protein
MKIKTLCLASALFSTQALAFPCFLTAVKDNCWTDYDVTITVRDAITDEQLSTVLVPKGKSWVRQPFTCKSGQRLGYAATFQPNIWENDKGKVFYATSFIMLPDQIEAGQKAWDLPVCFPLAFPGVPFPPKAIGNCKCDLKSIPPVPPMK